MNNSICGNCNTEFSGETCPNCGYNISARRPYKNVITDKKYKEQIADTAIAILVNNNLISMKKDLKHLIVKFGYLLLNEKTNELHTLIKVMPPKKMFQKLFLIMNICVICLSNYISVFKKQMEIL